MWLAYRWPDRRSLSAATWFREGSMLIARILISVYILNLGYEFEGSFTRLKDFNFVSSLFTATRMTESTESRDTVNSSAVPHVSNRFADTWLGRMPVPLPKSYVLGIDKQQKDFERYDHPSYLHGVWKQDGWWYYYLLACAIKVPLGFWFLGLIALVLSSRSARNGTNSSTFSFGDADKFAQLVPRLRDLLVLLAPPVVVFILVSAKTGINEHLRYVLPSFPFVVIWLSSAFNHRTYASSEKESSGKLNADFFRQRGNAFIQRAVIVLSIWTIVSSIWIYPHNLSYFNELVGGPNHGGEFLLGSNIDWGQDLFYFEQLTRNNTRNVFHKPIILAYFGGFDPAKAKDTADKGWKDYSSTLGEHLLLDDPAFSSDQMPCALSINLLFGGEYYGDSASLDTYISPATRAKLAHISPSAKTGYSILIYP
jgi:hypothetical protein